MNTDPFVELRGEVLREHIDVMDAVAQAIPGASRTSVLRDIIAEWVEHEKHRAMLVNRVAFGNGNVPEVNRSQTGSVPRSSRK